MSDLASRIASALDDATCEPWFPDLTEHLTRREWNRLQKEFGITPDTYSTGGLLRHSATVRPEVISAFARDSLPRTPNIRIEAVQKEWAQVYQAAGVRFYSSDEIKSLCVLECVGDALEVIEKIPTLNTTVHSLVRSLHLLKPPDSEYDVSFSEPHIPYSIFVSVFEERVPNDALRLAEAIIHEAMHLQLTLVDRYVPLVSLHGEPKYYSPWRQEKRSAAGLLHALYVFRVIYRFLAHVPNGGSYGLRRREQISREISEAYSLRTAPELTAYGIELVRRLFEMQQ